MKWVIKLENSQETDIQLVLNYCKEWLSKFDVRKLEEIRIVNTKGMHHTFFGHCSYPNKKKGTGFKVVCYIHEKISFPLKHHTRLSPIYFRKKGIEVPGAYALYEELQKNKDYFLELI